MYNNMEEIQKKFLEAITQGDVKGFQSLLQQGAKVACLEQNAYILRQAWGAIFAHHLEMLEIFIDAGAEISIYESKSGSLLSLAIDKNLSSYSGKNNKKITNNTLEYLVKHGASLNYPKEYSIISSDSPPPLFTAILWRDYKLFEQLLQLGCNPKILDYHQQTLLFYALKSYKVPLNFIKKLLSLGIEINHRDSDGETALHVAVSGYENNFVSLLLEHGAGINIQDNQGNTPLLTALKQEEKNLATLLIKAGADINLADKQGITPLGYCQNRTGYKRLFKLLEKQSGITPSSNRVSSTETFSKLNLAEPWAAQILAKIQTLPEAQQQFWAELFSLCFAVDNSRPTKTFLKKTQTVLEALGKDAVHEVLLECLPLVLQAQTKTVKFSEEFSESYSPWLYINDTNALFYFETSSICLIRGLLWLLADFNDIRTVRTLREIATGMFKKVPGVGMRNAKIANAALYALSQMSGDKGVNALAILRQQIKYNPALTHINRVFTKVAQQRQTTPEALAEQLVVDYGMQAVGIYTETIGDFNAELKLVKVGKTVLSWQKQGSDKIQKTVPAAVKRDAADNVKTLKSLAKDLQVASMAQRRILEKLYLEPKTWLLKDWQARYLEHPLCAFLGQRLLWRFHFKRGKPQVGIWHNGTMQDAQQNALCLDKCSKVELWHPIHSSVEEIETWRRHLINLEIVQPFKQAHREIYLLTDAERESGNQSQRFASHILRHHQVKALAEDRGWKKSLGGSWDGGDETDAYLSIPHANLVVEYRLQNMHELETSGIYMYVSSGSVQFLKRNTPQQLDQIPPLIFSEVMRDIDLFVAVASVGNDPEWEHRQEMAYWGEYNNEIFLASAETRKQVLAELLPKLKIAKQTRIEGRYLIVEGTLRTYKIHLGSGNIMMEPDDCYLCIVKTRDKVGNLYLPFEGDGQLSLILSKAFLLAADEKITDTTILSQIRRN
jgi:ankyrin repeat protein